MLLSAIEAINFRNLSGTIAWGPRLNIIYGNNGQGKTNWLEAINVLARTKSFRTQRLQEAIRFGEKLAIIRGTVTAGESIERNLQVSLQENTKAIFINQKKEPLTRYLSQLPVFSFTAADLEIVRGGPEARRRFLDRGVSSIKPAYLQTIADYTKVIKQKNRILQGANEENSPIARVEQLIGPWNDQLIKLAGTLHRERSDYVTSLSLALERQLFDRRHLSVRYLSSLEGKGDLTAYEDLLNTRLRLRLQAEIASGHALVGPHRDDLEVLLEGREIRAFGSSGQQRSALLLLDLAAISLYNLAAREAPIFIIDDVDAELDESRIRHLLEYLEDRTQTFITTSKRSHVEGFLSRASVYEIEEGVVRDRGTRAEVA